ncbi:MAG: hypothetical protein V7609_1144 [Verrucomicrobiota bacterium]
MRNRFISLAAGFFCTMGAAALLGQVQTPNPNENPEGNTGALKEQITTAGSYDAHSGNATRIAQDLHLPNALGKYGLDFIRYWNSLHPDFDNVYAQWPNDFGASGWSHSWRWVAQEGRESWQLDECGGSCGTQYWETSITIGFPDGHSNKYKISRADRRYEGQPLECQGRGWGPPYLAQCGERDWPSPGMGVHDRLSDMAQDGSEFWLHLADGGSVHFTGGGIGGTWQASEVFDPHGLRTDLHYRSDGRLDKVTQEGGRWLDITWDYRANSPIPVIVQVQSGGYAGVQTVIYNYNRYPDSDAGFPVLTSVDYPDDRAPGQPSHAIYTYGFEYTGAGPNAGVQAPYPLLKIANDPRYPGAMTTIRYDYYGGACPPPEHAPDPPPDGYFERFYPQPYAIAAEKSGETTIAVSLLESFCGIATRRETNGFGAGRMFYFGNSAGTQGSFGYHCLGFELAKVTDFFVGSPGTVPYQFQNFMSGQPRQVWDGRGILTENVVTPGDDSGLPGEVRHVGSNDGSSQIFNRVNAGNSDAQDFTKVPNRYNHWLFSRTDERGVTTTYRRDSRRRVVDITYPDTSSEHFTYNEFNQILTHTLPSGAVQHYEYNGLNQLQQQWNDVDGQANAVIYTYDALERVATVSYPWSRAAGASFGVALTYNGRHKIIREEYPATSAGPNPYVEYVYDDYGNCIEIWNELRQKSSYEYDSYRRCIRYTEPLNAPDWTGNPDPTTFIAARTWDWIYDRWIIDGVGQRDAYAHTKNEWRIQIEPAFNAAGDRRVTARAHDLQNRVSVESTGWIQPAGPIGNWYWSVPDGENHSFTYDANGQKSSYTDPQDRLTTYDYDLRNRLWKTTEPLSRVTETIYDVTGNKTLVTFPDNRTQQWLDYTPFGQGRAFH